VLRSGIGVLMKDWKAIAQASGLDIPPEEMDRIADPLNTLEASFRPLVKSLAFGLEPATVCPVEDDE